MAEDSHAFFSSRLDWIAAFVAHGIAPWAVHLAPCQLGVHDKTDARSVSETREWEPWQRPCSCSWWGTPYSAQVPHLLGTTCDRRVSGLRRFRLSEAGAYVPYMGFTLAGVEAICMAYGLDTADVRR